MMRLPYLVTALNDKHDKTAPFFRTGNLYPKNDNGDDDEDNKDLSGDGKDGGGKATNPKKRKALPTTAATVAANPGIVLGHGEAGGEVMTVTDATANAMTKKKAKLHHDDDTDDDHDDDEGITIAQKLANLSTQLDQEQKHEDRAKHGHDTSILTKKMKNGNGVHGGHGNGTTKAIVGAESTKNFIKNVTSDSLVILLRQALLSSDDRQLEVVLRVTDKKVIENTIMALTKEDGCDDSSSSQEEQQQRSSDLVIGLLTKLVTRLSRKPTRAHQLSFWIRTILMATVSCAAKEENDGGRNGGEGSWRLAAANKDIAAKLAPLRSLLHDRVESLPALMRLEGRLGLIGKQF